jgi:FkbM family methyltransferase
VALLKIRGRSNAMKLLLAGLVRRGDVVFDVGANTGIFTAMLSNLAGPSGRVHAFEPSPETCALLRETLNARALDAANVEINQSAVGTHDGSATLFTPREDHGQASLRTHERGSWSGDAHVRSSEVPVTSLDSYVARRPEPRPDVVKLDVEGAELPAIRGFSRGLRSAHPIVVCEICGDWTSAFGYKPSDVIDELKDAGYDEFHLVSARGDLVDLGSADVINDGESRDLVATVRAKHAGRVQRLMK